MISRHHLPRPQPDEHSLLAQQPTQGVQARRALRHPALSQAVQRGQDLLLGRLDGHGADVAVVVGLH